MGSRFKREWQVIGQVGSGTSYPGTL